MPKYDYDNISNRVSNIMSAKRQRNILGIIILLLLLLLWFGYTKYMGVKTNLNISKQNEKALSDSLRVSKNKIGDLVFSKNIIVSVKNDLNKLNKDLVNELKKIKGEVNELNKIIVQIKSDTIYIKNNLLTYNDSTYGLKWDYDTIYDENNYRKLSGISKFKLDSNYKVNPLNTMITDDKINFSLVTGLREKNGNIEIFAYSPYPNLNITKMDGAIINPNKHPVIKKFTNKKRIGIGPYLGVGIGISTNQIITIKPSYQIGIGIQYSLIKL